MPAFTRAVLGPPMSQDTTQDRSSTPVATGRGYPLLAGSPLRLTAPAGEPRRIAQESYDVKLHRQMATGAVRGLIHARIMRLRGTETRPSGCRYDVIKVGQRVWRHPSLDRLRSLRSSGTPLHVCTRRKDGRMGTGTHPEPFKEARSVAAQPHLPLRGFAQHKRERWVVPIPAEQLLDVRRRGQCMLQNRAWARG